MGETRMMTEDKGDIRTELFNFEDEYSNEL